MVIYGRNEEEHDRNLILFLETTRKNGLILNKRKLQFKKEEVSFFIHMSQYDTIGKIELIPASVLSTDKTNC